ncbi:MAG: hypothetical protein P3X23_010560 [Thermosynechococcus sp. Uc]|uniref:hypothetical protein n=1 Tax=Thermosynechococcus sp. Uc TaxID=3034853 RepID=UPI0019F7E735|nr:hypothetical protein [Thermosynechococcus sp. Uc]MDM7327537.1 hypothetical protein [Thermosynechococcus sp. Uc]HIK24960.1 hypothetical protein [Thermosynechococcus sp. M46_R2017_013]
MRQGIRYLRHRPFGLNVQLPIAVVGLWQILDVLLYLFLCKVPQLLPIVHIH